MAHQDLDPKGRWMGSGTFPKIITEGLWATKHLFLPDLFELCTNSKKNVFGCFQLLLPTPNQKSQPRIYKGESSVHQQVFRLCLGPTPLHREGIWVSQQIFVHKLRNNQKAIPT